MEAVGRDLNYRVDDCMFAKRIRRCATNDDPEFLGQAIAVPCGRGNSHTRATLLDVCPSNPLNVTEFRGVSLP